MRIVLLKKERGCVGRQRFYVDPVKATSRSRWSTYFIRCMGKLYAGNGKVQFNLSSPGIFGSIVVAAGSGKSGNDNEHGHPQCSDLFANTEWLHRHLPAIPQFKSMEC